MKGKIINAILIILMIGGIIMAHDKTYVICENMCMEEGMTKDQINTLFKKQELKVYEKTVTLTTIEGQVLNFDPIPYTDGMTPDNCYVLPVKIQYPGNNWYNASVNRFYDSNDDPYWVTEIDVKYHATRGILISGRLHYGGTVGDVVKLQIPVLVVR